MDRMLVIMLLATVVPGSALAQAVNRPAAKPPAAITPQAPAPTSVPGPEHKKLQMWVGDWTYEGEDKATSFQPARTYTGKATARPMLGGAFVEWVGEDGDGGSWREIDGYDAVNKRYFWHAYYDDGSVEVMTYRIEGNTVTLSGTTDVDGKPARLRGTFVFALDGRSFVEKLQVSLDGGKSWIQAWEIRFKKAPLTTTGERPS